MKVKARKWILETQLLSTYEKLGKKRKGKFKKDVMFSSATDLWSTQQEIFDKLDDIFNFTLDPCSTHENAKCDYHFTLDDDGLKQSWKNNVVYVNPPYGNVLKDWVIKSYEESKHNNALVVMLIPSRTDTKYEHDIIFKHAKAVVFVKGRFKFGSQKNSAPFPSQFVVFGDVSEKICHKLSIFGKVVIL